MYVLCTPLSHPIRSSNTFASLLNPDGCLHFPLIPLPPFQSVALSRSHAAVDRLNGK